MRKKPLTIFAGSLITFLCICSAQAELQLSSLFANHMVMQRDMPVPVWGWAEPGEQITIAIDNQRHTATADATGKWMARLAPMSVGEARKMAIKGKVDLLEITDILVGDVWVCAGQSNMEWAVQNSKDGAKEIESANHPEIRLFEVGNGVSPNVPQQKLKSSAAGTPNCIWNLCSPETIKGFSAVGYYFGRTLNRDLKVPVGLISNSVGGTPIETWMSREGLSSDPDLKIVLDFWKRMDSFAETAEGKSQLEAVYKKYDELEAAARKVKKHIWRESGFVHPLKRINHASSLFNGRVSPLLPYAIKGVIWYQGEGNTGSAYEYRKQFPALIQDWRNHWGQGDFPFLFVQLANWGGPPPENPSESPWAELREAQTLALKMKNTGMAVTIDIGDPLDMHPLNKQEVGARLALAAKAVAYGQKIIYSGPLFRNFSIEEGRIRISFDSSGNGLVARGGALRSFAIAGEDKKFVWARAEIEGDTIVVASDQVKQPVAVRYGWFHNPGCNLYNEEGLPASPFRTDSWAGITDNKGYRARVGKPIKFEAPKVNP